VTRPPRLGSFGARLELGLVAFTPAMALLAWRARQQWAWVAFAVPAAVGALVAVVAVLLVRRGNPEPYTLVSIEDLGDEVIGHVASFLLPAVVDVGTSGEQAVIAALVLALIVHIHVATGRVHVSPLLYLLGYRVLRATTDTGVAFHLVARSDVSGWTGPRRLVPLGASLLVERPGDVAPRGDGTTPSPEAARAGP
jgi:hypothetical protein